MPERKNKQPNQLHWLIGRLSKIGWNTQFVIRYTGGWYGFSRCLRAHTIHWHPSASPWPAMVTHLPQPAAPAPGCSRLSLAAQQRCHPWSAWASLLKRGKTSSYCLEWIKSDASHRGRNCFQHHWVTPCKGNTGLAGAAGSKESI